MSPSVPPIPTDPADYFTPGEAIDQWKDESDAVDPRDLPTPQSWIPPGPQELAPAEPAPMPDWSPSSGDVVPPVIDPPQNPTEHPGSGAAPHGEHDRPANRVEDPDGGDPEDPGAERPDDARARLPAPMPAGPDT